VESNAGYATAVEYLLTLKSRGVALGLERMQRFVAALGDPQRAVPCIHVAGTNGKGSVAAMLESILRAAGWRTGLYTSPHLIRLGERVQVNRQILSPSEITAYVSELRAIAETIERAEGAAAHPSYFEFMTAMAMLHFQRARCDIAVVEVGLGGRLDATNVVTPQVSVITSIGLDHCELLGGTLAAIAGEKAGIIKPGRPVVMGRLPAEAEDVVRTVAAANEARIFSVREVFGEAIERHPRTNLEGEYQRINAATATLAARQLPAQWRIGEAAIERGLGNVQWSGRWQRFSIAGRTVIIDGAHNPEAAGMLDRNLAHLREETGRAPIIVTGVLGLARARAVLEVCCRYAKEIHLVVPAQRRACSFEQLESAIPPSYTGRVVRTSVPAVFPRAGDCAAGVPGDVMVVTGSLYLAGEVLARLDPEAGPAEAHLQDF
jgi:dihydrofolate synthase/folylpolyglutamate synthase